MVARTREDLHELIDQLAEGDVPTVRRLLRYLSLTAGDPVLRAVLGAVDDDEQPTAEDLAALKEAYDDVETGRLNRREAYRG